MIVIDRIKKTYVTKDNKIDALKETSLEIKKGEIFGIIGYSGAGKSTLLRCINLLETPDSGRVIINGNDLTKFNSNNLKKSKGKRLFQCFKVSREKRELRKCRAKIGMIFQHFNLMKSRTVFENVAYPLSGKGLLKKDIEKKVKELLDLVGLKEKANAYPSELSGGQKQRVAIARALANDPEVLLCDEATSALDPKTTKSILELLKKINSLFDITIVLITHEMTVVKEICNRVAVMENGYVVEEGSLMDIFLKPKATITKDFIDTVLNKEEELKAAQEVEGENVYKISFIGNSTRKPIISEVSRNFNVDVNILYGNIERIQDVPFGDLIVSISGQNEKIVQAINYLNEEGIKVEVIKNVRNIQELGA